MIDHPAAFPLVVGVWGLKDRQEEVDLAHKQTPANWTDSSQWSPVASWRRILEILDWQNSCNKAKAISAKLFE